MIDPYESIFKKKFYREHCDKDNRHLIYKDLKRVQGEDLTNLIMIDDSEVTYQRNIRNHSLYFISLFIVNTYMIAHWTKN